MVLKKRIDMKKLIEKLEAFLELGGIKKDVTLLALSGVAVICSLCGVRLGSLLEELTVAKARAGIEKLLHLMPQTARVVSGGEEKIIPAEEVQAGDPPRPSRREHPGRRRDRLRPDLYQSGGHDGRAAAGA